MCLTISAVLSLVNLGKYMSPHSTMKHGVPRLGHCKQ